jgi:ubiquinone/menaquinone biosynthesis C-methylase UbiE
MSESQPKAPPQSPLATPEPWNLVSAGYVTELWDQFSRFSKDALELANVAPKSDVLDVCTGPGTLALQAAQSARRVVGVDFSPSMLEELRRRAKEGGVTNVEAVEADGQALPFGDASFDAAFSMFGLIFFPDRGKGFRELFRVLRPGGRAVVASWRPFDTVPPIKAVFEVLLEFMPELPFGKSKAPLGEPDEFRAELEAAGFSAVDVRMVSHKDTASSVGAFWTSMARSTAPLVLLRNRIGEERWAKLSESLLAKLTERFGPGPLDIEPFALLGMGTKA